jgi:hypothetical protein
VQGKVRLWQLELLLLVEEREEGREVNFIAINIELLSLPNAII